jgi:hypothetical protein
MDQVYMSAKNIFLGVPTYGLLNPLAFSSLMLPSFKHAVKLRLETNSILPHNFNLLFGTALTIRAESGLTHFAMHHADIAAPCGWIDTLVDEMERVGADILSTVIPLKDHRGLTSTAFRNGPTYNEIQRYTMTEIMSMPETFSGTAEHPLLVNTGLWIMDFSKDWVEEFPGFKFNTGIIKRGGGKFEVTVEPEDWLFSDWANERGLKVFATRKVEAHHAGEHLFGNNSAWGQWQTDLTDRTPFVRLDGQVPT